MLTSSFCFQSPRFLFRKSLAWNYRIESLKSTRMTLIYFFSLAVLFFSRKIHQTSDQRIWTQFQGKHYLEFDVDGEKTIIFLHRPLSHVVPRILYEVSSPSVVTFNPTLNLFAISVKVFHSLANNFSMLMIPLNYFSFFFLWTKFPVSSHSYRNFPFRIPAKSQTTLNTSCNGTLFLLDVCQLNVS